MTDLLTIKKQFPNLASSIEAVIIEKIIQEALKLGFLISVFDGEEYEIEHATDINAIAKAVAITDETTLAFFNQDRQKLGWIWLIHGNEWDVISDYADNGPIKVLMKPVNEFVDQLQTMTDEQAAKTAEDDDFDVLDDEDKGE